MNNSFLVTHPSYDMVSQASRHIINGLDNTDFRAEVIIGLARGGLVPSVILSQSLNVPMLAVHYSSKVGRGDDRNHENNLPEFSAGTKILIVDDICDSGHTMKEVADHYQAVDCQVKTAVLYYKEGSVHVPDFYWHPLPKDAPFIVFPWERNVKYMNL